MAEALVTNAAILLVLATGLWAISVRIGDVSFVDAFWGAGMAALAIASWLQVPRPGAVATLLMVMTVAWGLRLAVHLFRRWRREGEDTRYARILRKDREAGRFASAALFRVFLPQSLLLFLVCSPAQLGILAGGSPAPVGGVAWAGVFVFLVGIGFEWIGDWQLARFRADPANRGQVMDRGLWRYTRHPNYFGDACAWWGIWIVAASMGWEIAALTIAGPVFLTFTLMRWSGAPMLERQLAKSRPGYDAYQRRTSPFLPMPPHTFD